MRVRREVDREVVLEMASVLIDLFHETPANLAIEALANPQALDEFEGREELAV